ncbi:hypothetical protein LT679_02025 [Mucilaginibacter roseus]|uniref:Uncharacterized protein n=1 Tax=Mucilaginibacter roseus TaxID=1528868 RepID=A0ABS8U0I4_9SPHI|nr:hypothetical protein [Mucilaginibacter roseus]MCD8739367.1 hypothetical protein [Mucilaginibacter roseus]
MINIEGIEIDKPPFQLEWIGDLLFFDWSLIGVYKNSDGSPFIKAWLDNDEILNRYVIFEVKLDLLEKYIFGKLPYSVLISNPVKDLMFCVEFDSIDNIHSCKIIAVNNFPKSYLPENDVCFDEHEASELNRIIDSFKLKNIVLFNKDYAFDILQESKNTGTELINLHLASKNNKVGYGKIQSQVLGQALVNYHKIAEATVVNLFDRSNKTVAPTTAKSRWQKGELEKVKQLAVTEYLYDKAASFSVFLKPLKPVIYDNTGKTTSETITETIFNLFEAGTDLSKLNDSMYSQSMLTAFSGFLKSIKENDVSITVQYANPFKGNARKKRFDSYHAEIIMKNLSALDISAPIKSRYKGTFTALDRIRYTFDFLTEDNKKIQGKFDKQIIESVPRLNLQKDYLVTIETVLEMKSGRKDPIERHTIISCVQIKEDR